MELKVEVPVEKLERWVTELKDRTVQGQSTVDGVDDELEFYKSSLSGLIHKINQIGNEIKTFIPQSK